MGGRVLWALLSSRCAGKLCTRSQGLTSWLNLHHHSADLLGWVGVTITSRRASLQLTLGGGTNTVGGRVKQTEATHDCWVITDSLP